MYAPLSGKSIRWIALFLICGTPLHAQEFEELLNSYGDHNARGYLQPLADMITSNLNTGIREWSSVDSSFYLSLRLVTMTSFPSASMKTFRARTGFDFEPEQEAMAPTVIGPNQPTSVEGVNGTYFIFPVGYNVRYFPLVAPQLTIGGFFHTELTGRFFSFAPKKEVDNIAFLGLGLRHNVSAYLPDFPWDLSAGYFYQQFNTAPYYFSKHHLASLHIGKSGKRASAHLTLGYQMARTRIEYTYTDDSGQPQQFSVPINNKYPVLAELTGAVKLWIILLHGSVAWSGPVTATVGLGFKF